MLLKIPPVSCNEEGKQEGVSIRMVDIHRGNQRHDTRSTEVLEVVYVSTRRATFRTYRRAFISIYHVVSLISSFSSRRSMTRHGFHSFHCVRQI